MRIRALSSSAFVLSLFLAPTAAHAAEPEWLPGAPSDRVRAEPLARDKARVYLDERSAELDLAAVELGAARELASAGGSTVVRIDQVHEGVPVLGKAAIVRVGAGGDVTRVVLHLARNLTVSSAPTLSQREASTALAAAYGAPGEPFRAELVVSSLGAGALLWQLDVRDVPGGTRYWIDAHTGEPFGNRPLAVHAQGRVYAMNSVETPAPVDVELLELDVADPQRLNGWGGLLAVTNYASGGQQGYVLEQTLGPNSGADFLYDPPAEFSDPTDGFAQVNLYHHLTSMRTFAGDLGVTMTDPSWKLTAVANALEGGGPLDNAFFSQAGQEGPDFEAPNLISIGQGSQNDFAYDSDVFKHEFGHYFTHNAVGYNMSQLHFTEYGLSPHSGSIDEGIADYLACSDNDDAELGEASLGPLGGLRDLTDTSMRCPEDILGEVHEDGKIAGSLAWSIRTLLGKEIGDQVVWGGVTTLPPGATFGDLGRGFIAAAEELASAGTITATQLGEVEALVASRGLDECDHVIPLDPGETKVENAIGLDLLGQLFGQSCATLQGAGAAFQGLFHFSRTTAATDALLRFQVDATPIMGGGSPQFAIYGRKGQNVTLQAQGGFLPVPDEFDFHVDVDAASGELVVQGADFEPGAEYFFVVLNRGCPSLQLTVGTSTEAVTPGTTSSTAAVTTGTGGSDGTGGEGGGGSPPDDEDDGCDCRGASGDTRGGGWALAALGLAALLRRRRR